MMRSLVRSLMLKELCLIVILSYPLFYHTYKFSTPKFGGKDYESYYRLYKDWDFKSVESPFNMRLISTSLVYIVHQTGIYYNGEIVFTDPRFDQSVFFSAVLVNYIFVVLTCLVIGSIIRENIRNEILVWAGMVLYLLGFGTIFFELSPLADSCGVFLFALVLKFYLRKSYWFLLFMFLSLFQREYTFFVFGLVGLMEAIFNRERRFNLMVMFASGLFFVMYFILRKTLFYTSHFDHQITLDDYGQSVFTWQFPLGAYIRQSLLIQNILFLYLAVVLYKRFKKLSVDVKDFWIVVALFLQINVISVIAVLGNNTGRYFYIVTPLIIFYIVKELSAVIPQQDKAAVTART